MAVKVERRGRKRSVRAEHVSRRVRELKRVESDRALAEKQPHRSWLPKAKRLDPLAESHFGCLYLCGAVSSDLFEAGLRYKKGVADYWAVIQSRDPKRQKRIGNGEDIPAEEARRRTDRYNEAFEVLSAAGRKALMAVKEVAIYDRHADLHDLHVGLSTLARYYRLTVSRHPCHTRNRP